MSSASRISRDTMLMGIAHLVAQRGTCSRLQVGAVVARDARVLVTGYNGAPARLEHCLHPKPEGWSGLQESLGCEVSVHAEMNAVAYAARWGITLEGAEMYCTHAPCVKCAQLIINSGIVMLTYAIPYRKHEGLDLLDTAGLQFRQLTMSDSMGS